MSGLAPHMRLAWCLIFGTVAVCNAGASGSSPWPVSSTYNSVDLNASVAFMVEYMGAVSVPANLTAATAGCNAAMQWVTQCVYGMFVCLYLCATSVCGVKTDRLW